MMESQQCYFDKSKQLSCQPHTFYCTLPKETVLVIKCLSIYTTYLIHQQLLF